MSQYDLQEQAIQRQKMIAAALRDSGNIPNDQITQTAGGYVIPISPWQQFGKIANIVGGAFEENRANKAAQKLADQKQADAEAWFKDLNSVSPADALSPVTPTAQYELPSDPSQIDTTALAQQLRQHQATQQSVMDANQQTETDMRNHQMAAYLKGLQLGGVPAAISQQGLERDMKVPDPVKLGEGDILVNPRTGAQLAQGLPKQYKPPEADRALVNVDDGKGGYKTIPRSEWEAQGRPKLYEKPPNDAFAQLQNGVSPTMDAMAARDAEAIANLQKAPPSTNNRNPYNVLVWNKLLENHPDYDAAKYPARAAALRAFGPDKPAGKTVTSFSVLSDHLETLEAAGEALKNHDTQALNRLTNFFKEQFGKAPPSTFEALKDNIRGEIVKGITGGPGAESDRQEALAKLSKASSPEQLASVLQGLRTLIGGQLEGKRREWITQTGLSEDEFNKRLSPAAMRLKGFESSQADQGLTPPTPGAPVVKGNWSISRAD
ncbi:MAG TPA: hypothetical protein VFA39_15610 [Steroidobacteraceae bacterium]|nr:hypothetical protein [Steroidobacteraceae bacterium]